MIRMNQRHLISRWLKTALLTTGFIVKEHFYEDIQNKADKTA